MVVELLVITTSIVLAFALDAWWDARGDRVDERKLLVALHEEFEAVKAELLAARRTHSSRQTASASCGPRRR